MHGKVSETSTKEIAVGQVVKMLELHARPAKERNAMSALAFSASIPQSRRRARVGLVQRFPKHD